MIIENTHNSNRPHLSANKRLVIEIANETDRKQIASMRHAVYAEELAQHSTNSKAALSDPLDAFNIYIVARLGNRVVGFVSITPPQGDDNDSVHSFSIDKYIDRSAFPFEFDSTVYEVRLLTVDKEFRSLKVAAQLMYASYRWVAHQGGTRIIAIGRREVIGLYQNAGFNLLGIIVRSGKVEYELMTATIDEINSRTVPQRTTILKTLRKTDWQLDVPIGDSQSCYHGGAFFESIGERFNALHRRNDVINADVLDAWFDPSPKVNEALNAHLPWLIRTSPPTDSGGLQEVIAQTRGVESKNILPGAGSSDLIYLALRQWVKADSRVLILDPMYGEYAHVLEKVIGCKVDRFSLSREEDYIVNLHLLNAELTKGYDLIVLVNPNSPTGRHISHNSLREVLANAPAKTRFWIDETYIEYVGSNQSLEQFAAASKNVIICKSMSKVYALSGARAAYLCGPSNIIDELRPLTPPWAVSLLGQVAAVNALNDPQYYAQRYIQTHQLRANLQQALSNSCALEVLDGVANFLLCQLREDGPGAAEVARECRKRNLFIRDASNLGTGLGAHVIRIAVKDDATNKRIVHILKDALDCLAKEKRNGITNSYVHNQEMQPCTR